jgi:hypothetical protein
MAEALPFVLLPGQEEIILSFLNRISHPSEITDNKRLTDDPFYDGSGGYSIGKTTAESLINARENLPGGRFRRIQQLLDVAGIGHDKVQDLIYSFWKPADDFFRENLYQKGILLDNWKVETWQFDFIYNEERFLELAEDRRELSQFLEEQVREIIYQKHQKYSMAKLASRLLCHLPLEQHTLPAASSAVWAAWWYRFDEDNWFSFDAIQQETSNYFHYYEYEDNRIELYFYREFPNGGTFAEAVTPDDLPVTLNRGERRITIWAASLFD